MAAHRKYYRHNDLIGRDMKVIITGGRDYEDWHRFNSLLDAMHDRCHIISIIEGGAQGADALARAWASNNNVHNLTIRAKWDDVDGVDPDHIKIGKFGKPYNVTAGFDRNKLMADGRGVDLCIGFAGGKGTRHMMETAISRGIPTLHIPDVTTDMIISFDGEHGIDSAKPDWLLPPPAGHRLRSPKRQKIDRSVYLQAAEF